MDNEEKQAIVGKAMDTRRGRKNLAWTMTQPISPGMRHPCHGCGHQSDKAMCENIVHATDENKCWYPFGTLAIADEKKGRKFLKIVTSPFNCDNCVHGFGIYQGSPCWGCSPTAVFNGWEPGEVHWKGDGSLVIWDERNGII